jgi:hypothetical protein
MALMCKAGNVYLLIDIKCIYEAFSSREYSVAVSHTVHDLIFIWNVTDPLVVNPDIELPQLDISNNYTADCTIEYSTGWSSSGRRKFSLDRRKFE